MGSCNTVEGPYLPSHNDYDYSTESSNRNLSHNEVGITGVDQQSFTAYGCSEQEYQVVNSSQVAGASVIEQTQPIDTIAEVSSLISGCCTPKLKRKRSHCSTFKPGLSRMVLSSTSIRRAGEYC